MVFSSSTFLLVFLPIVLAAYFVVPNRTWRNLVLLVSSLVFYAWGEPVYVVLMIISIAANWAAGVAIGALPNAKRLVLVADVVINVLLIGFFKYEAFLARTVNAVIGSPIVPELDLPLPIGISFYTLQAQSYVIDVYRGDVPPEKSPWILGMYVAMFPQLVAGPIVRYSTILDQVRHRKESLRQFVAGVRLFSIGFAKKVLLANVVAILATDMLAQGGPSIGAVGAWAGIIAYTFQILFDFSGYSDMAIGLGKMFGFEYLRNFNYPYLSQSATEFWRRWHISLGSFFRDYIYIPLGGNRVTRSRWIVNIFAVWFLTGLWHGAAWNFVLWGLYFGVVLVVEKLWLNARLVKLPAPLRHAYAIAVFMFGWLVFWIEDPGVFASYLSALAGGYGATGSSTFWELGAWEFWPVFFVCVIASTPVVPWLRERLVAWTCDRDPVPVREGLASPKELSAVAQCDAEAWIDEAERANAPHGRKAVMFAVLVAADAACIGLLVLSALGVVSGSFNPFIYFRF